MPYFVYHMGNLENMNHYFINGVVGNYFEYTKVLSIIMK